MRILFSSLSGHDKTESIHYLEVLRRLGHEPYRVGVPTAIDDLEKGFWAEAGFAPNTPLSALIRLAGFDPDLFLYIEPHGLIPPGLHEAPFPTACILCDTHTNLLIRLRLARFFDHVFLYHRNYLHCFSEHPTDHVHWLPYACDLEVFRPLDVERDLDVGFVGQLHPDTERARLIETLAQRYRVNQQRYYLRTEIPSVYARSKIVLNLPLADDLNFRTFEAMSCGAMLLTRRLTNGQELLFEEGTHYAAFADEQELMNKVAYYLSHPAEREMVAAAGLLEIQQRHRLDQRIERLLGTVQSKPNKVAPIRHMTPSQVDREYAWVYEELHRSNPGPGLTLLRQARKAGRPWLPLLLPVVRSVIRGVIYK